MKDQKLNIKVVESPRCGDDVLLHYAQSGGKEKTKKATHAKICVSRFDELSVRIFVRCFLDVAVLIGLRGDPGLDKDRADLGLYWAKPHRSLVANDELTGSEKRQL